MKVFYIYKTTHVPSKKFYIGKHEANSLENKYLGSGKYIKNLLISTPKEEILKEILQICSSREELIEAEKAWILKYYDDPLNMNYAYGGTGGPVLTAMKEREPERYKAYCEAQSKNLDRSTHYGKKHRDGIKRAWKSFKEKSPEPFNQLRKASSDRMKRTKQHLKENPELAKAAEEKRIQTLIKKYGSLENYYKMHAANVAKTKNSNPEKYSNISKEAGKITSETYARLKKEQPEEYQKMIDKRAERIREHFRNNPRETVSEDTKNKIRESLKKTRETYKAQNPEEYALKCKERQAKSVLARKLNKEKKLRELI